MSGGARVVAEQRHPAHHSLALACCDLVADALAGELALELREGQRYVEHQSPHRDRGVELLITETKDTPKRSKISMIVYCYPCQHP